MMIVKCWTCNEATTVTNKTYYKWVEGEFKKKHKGHRVLMTERGVKK